MAQLHHLRSMYSAKVPIGLGLQAWASGTSRDKPQPHSATVTGLLLANYLRAIGDTPSSSGASSVHESAHERRVSRGLVRRQVSYFCVALVD